MNLFFVRNALNKGFSINDISLRVVTYSRVSTDHLEQKKSLCNQIEHFKEYILNNPKWTFVSGYVDDGISGTSDIKRENFMKMIDDAKEGLFDLIITKEISRFSRNTLDSIKYTRLLLSYGVAVFFVNDNINTIFSDSELRLTIMASMAQDEIRRLSERVKFGMNRAISRGEILGNDMLYGYKKDFSGNLKIIEDEAAVVRKIFNLYVVDNLSISKICKVLNNEKKYTRLGNKWCVSTISRMLENPKYKGFYCGKKSEIIDYMTKKVEYFDKNDWVIYENKEKIPPIVDNFVWDLANKRLMLRKKEYSARKFEKNIYKDRYLYSAKIFCNNHNSVFHRRKFNKEDVSWVCSMYLKNGKAFCNSFFLRELELNNILKDLILKLNIDFSKVLDKLTFYYGKVVGSEFEIEDISEFIMSNNGSDFIFEKIISLLLDHIVVKKVSDYMVKVDIYLLYKSNYFSCFYSFNRGYNVKCTKRYSVTYDVNFHFS